MPIKKLWNAGESYRELFSHKPGEQFMYTGGLFTRLIFSDSLAHWLAYSGMPEESIQLLQTTFLASDQFGVVNVFSRNDNVITVTTFPEWSKMYQTQPKGFPDATKILISPTAPAARAIMKRTTKKRQADESPQEGSAAVGVV